MQMDPIFVHPFGFYFNITFKKLKVKVLLTSKYKDGKMHSNLL
jgi:hypothetical protein